MLNYLPERLQTLAIPKMALVGLVALAAIILIVVAGGGSGAPVGEATSLAAAKSPSIRWLSC